MKSKPQEVKIHIEMVDADNYEWRSEGGQLQPDGLHVGKEDHVVFIADSGCEVYFVQPHYFKDGMKNLKPNIQATAGLKPQVNARQVSHWEVWTIGKTKKLKAVAHVHATTTHAAMNYSGAAADTAVMVSGEPDPVIQP